MNSRISPNEQERFKKLIMGAVDNELTPEQQTEFNGLIKRYPEFMQEWQHFHKLKEVMKTMKFKTPADQVWDKHWLGIYNRLERGIAWIIFSIGAVVLITYSLYQAVINIIADSQLNGIIKFGIIALIIGSVILLVSVAREKLITRKKDPYKEIQR